MAIPDWPAGERPREKLLQQGADALSDAELVAIVLRSGSGQRSAVGVARELLERFGSLSALAAATVDDVCASRGVGRTFYAQLQAGLELAGRCLGERLRERDTFANSSDTQRYLRHKLRHRSREVFACLFLDNRHRLIAYEELFLGTIDSASVHPREVVRRALTLNAAAVIAAHNHPSGVAEPSAADIALTRRLREALGLVDLRLLDHVVVGEGAPVSLAERGQL